MLIEISGKRGEGKTTIAIVLEAVFKAQHKTVFIQDADDRIPPAGVDVFIKVKKGE